MDQYTETLTHILRNHRAKIEVTFPGLNISASDIVEAGAFQALTQIQKIPGRLPER